MSDSGEMLPRIFPRSLTGCCLCLGLLWWVVSANDAGARVLDEAGIFSKELATQIQARTDECKKLSGVDLHVVTFADLDDHLENRSIKMLDELSGADPAIMLAFGWGMEAPLVKVSPTLGDRYPLGELTRLLAKVRQPFIATDTTLSQKFDICSQLLNEGLIELEKKRQALQSRHFPKELFLSLAAVVLGAALLLWMALLWLQKRSARHEKFYFPDLEVGLRLGAPFGGGLVVLTQAKPKKNAR